LTSLAFFTLLVHCKITIWNTMKCSLFHLHSLTPCDKSTSIEMKWHPTAPFGASYCCNGHWIYGWNTVILSCPDASVSQCLLNLGISW
jgi:hypothetical protein